MTSNRLLEINDLSTVVDAGGATVRAVDDISFTLHEGETLGLVGESGSGKTMVALSIARLLPNGGRLVSGSIRFEGTDLSKLDEREMRLLRGRKIGMVFQDPMTSLNPTMRIGPQVVERLRLRGGSLTASNGLSMAPIHVSKSLASRRAQALLEQTGVPSSDRRVNQYPHQLSGGLRQRALIAMALAATPSLLIADEPTTALDVTIQAQILRLLDQLKEHLRLSMILITHDLGVIAGRADRVAVMYAGRIIEMADTRDLFRRPQHPYTVALLATAPDRRMETGNRLFSIPGEPPDLRVPSAGCSFAPRCAHASGLCWVEKPILDGPIDGHTFACFHPSNAASVTIASARPRRAAQVSRGPSDPSDLVLNVLGVSKDFPADESLLWGSRTGTIKAVSDVSISLVRGETLGIVGESGCGKTTLGRLLVGLDVPDRGQVLMNGKDLTSLRGRALRAEQQQLQFMFQDSYASLDPRMRTGSIIEEPLRIQGLSERGSRRQRVRELLSEVGLSHQLAENYPHQLSGGQRQRVALARALATKPSVIVADEPVSALDMSIRSQILNLMKDLQAEHRMSYVVISHDLTAVHYLADRIAVMYLGKLVEEGPAEDILLRPAHPYTAALVEAAPIPDPDVDSAKATALLPGEPPSPLHPPSGCRFRTRCPRVQELCAAEEPALNTVGKAHLAACHFPLLPEVL